MPSMIDAAIESIIAKSIDLVRDRIAAIRRVQGFGKVEVRLENMTPLVLTNISTRSDAETRPLRALSHGEMQQVLHDLADNIAFIAGNHGTGHVTLSCTPKQLQQQATRNTTYELE